MEYIKTLKVDSAQQTKLMTELAHDPKNLKRFLNRYGEEAESLIKRNGYPPKYWKSRPSLGKDQVETVWENAKKDPAKTFLTGDTKENNMNYDLMDAYDLAELGTLKLFLEKYDKSKQNEQNRYGFSLLHEALSGHKWDIAEFLINEGIDINLKDSGGNTALHYLCDTNDITQAITTAKLLLAHGADINIQNQKGSTVLILAILRVQGHENCSFVEFLCQQHPDFTLKNKAGKTALEIAQMVEAIHENCKLSELIRRYL